jgi:ribose transport system permease protein
MGSSSLAGIPTLALILIGFAILVHFVLAYTIHGRNTYAVGGNRQASIDAGIRVGPNIVINFAICGFLAALAGVTLSSQMGAATPNLGRDFELWAITAVVLGGTKLTGGVGSIVGTFGGVIAIGILRNGMNLLQVPSFYVLVIMGVILITVLFFDRQVNMRLEKEVE